MAEEKSWREKHRHGYERAVLGSLAAGAGLVLAGAVGAAVPGLYEAGMATALLGAVFTALAAALSGPLLTLRTIAPKQAGGLGYERLKHWQGLKTASILLNMLVLASGVALLFALLARLDLIEARYRVSVVLRMGGVLAASLAVTTGIAHFLSLRVEIERTPIPLGPAFLALCLAGSVAFAALGGAVLPRGLPIAGAGRLRPTDAPYFLLAALLFASVAVFLARGLPTVYALFAEERQFYRGRAYLSRSKSVLMPALVAFALLFLVVLLLLVFGIGVVGFVEETQRSAILVGVFVLLLAATGTSLAMTILLARRKDRAELVRVKRSKEATRALFVLSGSLAAAAALLALAAAVAGGAARFGIPRNAWIDLVAFAALAGVGPYGFYVAARARRSKRMEERFPDFLRDIASSVKAGLTMPHAAAIAARGEYGALTPEVVKLADQLSWNVPFEEALGRFAERVDTPLAVRAVSLITEASHSGGHVTDVLTAAAKDVREIKNMENERRLSMGLYTAIVYIAFSVFLVVAAVLYNQFVPSIAESSKAALGEGSTGFGGVSFQALDVNDYREFYFLAALMQGLGNGMVAGLMGTGRALAGLRHAFFMVLIAYLTFALVL